jgi:hypothetical protein
MSEHSAANFRAMARHAAEEAMRTPEGHVRSMLMEVAGQYEEVARLLDARPADLPSSGASEAGKRTGIVRDCPGAALRPGV